MAVEKEEKSLLVSKKEFDRVLNRLVESKPLPKRRIRARSKHAPKTAILAKQ